MRKQNKSDQEWTSDAFWRPTACIRAHAHANMYACTRICTHARAHSHARAPTYTHARPRTHTRAHVHARAHTYTHADSHRHRHTHTHKSAHTSTIFFSVFFYSAKTASAQKPSIVKTEDPSPEAPSSSKRMSKSK